MAIPRWRFDELNELWHEQRYVDPRITAWRKELNEEEASYIAQLDAERDFELEQREYLGIETKWEHKDNPSLANIHELSNQLRAVRNTEKIKFVRTDAKTIRKIKIQTAFGILLKVLLFPVLILLWLLTFLIFLVTGRLEDKHSGLFSILWGLIIIGVLAFIGFYVYSWIHNGYDKNTFLYILGGSGIILCVSLIINLLPNFFSEITTKLFKFIFY